MEPRTSSRLARAAGAGRVTAGTVALLAAALGLVSPAAALAQTLETRGYRVTIEPRCAEGEVDCGSVGYTGVSRRSGLRIELTGRALHLRCADGVTPCRFIGWAFRNGDTVYRVSDDGELLVTRGDAVLVRQRGRWMR